jgi:hypothetical protein
MGWWNGRVWVGIHLVVLTAGAYVAADLVNLLIARQLEASIRVDDRAPGDAPGAVSRVLPDPVAYARILEGNLFNPALRGPALPPVVDAPSPTAPLDVQMTLIGTGEGEGAPSFAVIEDRVTREQRVYRVGDVVKDGVVLAKVERNQVVLRLGAQQQVLSLYTDGTEDVASGGGPPGDVAAVTGGVRQVQTNRWVLDKHEVSAALETLP